MLSQAAARTAAAASQPRLVLHRTATRCISRNAFHFEPPKHVSLTARNTLLFRNKQHPSQLTPRPSSSSPPFSSSSPSPSISLSTVAHARATLRSRILKPSAASVLRPHNVPPLPPSSQLFGAGSLLNQGLSRAFHSSRPSRMPAPLLPVVLMSLKTPFTAVVLRAVSRISLTLLPLSVKRSPKVILTLVLIPPICFGLVIVAGLEPAPNTGRWRFVFVNPAEEFQMIEEEIPSFMSSIKTIDDPSDERVKLVRHILTNLLNSGAIEADGSTIKQYYFGEDEDEMLTAGTDKDGKKTVVTKKRKQTEESRVKTEAIHPIDSEKVFEERPFQIFVVEDENINAFSLGPPRLIYINSGLLKWLENDEDLVAAVIAHELAHVIQRHTMETHGRETILLFLADLFRSALWTVSIPLGPWFNSWIDETTNSLLHFTASGPLHQTIEVEADTVSLSLLALSGYDPMHSVRLWEQWAEMDQLVIELEKSEKIHSWTDWMSDHPPSAERAAYLKESVVPARTLWEKVVRLQQSPLKRFRDLGAALKHGLDEDGDLIQGTAEEIMATMDVLMKQQQELEEQEAKNRWWPTRFKRWAGGMIWGDGTSTSSTTTTSSSGVEQQQPATA